MSDLILAEIKSNLEGEGYTVYTGTEPAVREWTSVPCVLIVPQTRTSITWHAFTHRNMKHQYLCVYVSNNALNTVPTTASYDFKQYVISEFMGEADSTLFAIDGVWQSRVTDLDDFNAALLPQGYNYSALNISVDLILDT